MLEYVPQQSKQPQQPVVEDVPNDKHDHVVSEARGGCCISRIISIGGSLTQVVTRKY